MPSCARSGGQGQQAIIGAERGLGHPLRGGAHLVGVLVVHVVVRGGVDDLVLLEHRHLVVLAGGAHPRAVARHGVDRPHLRSHNQVSILGAPGCPGRGAAWRGGDPGRTATSAPPIGWRAARSPPAAPVHEARALLVEPSGREGEEASHPYGDPDAAVVLHLREPAALHRTLHLYGAGHVTCCPWSRIPRYGCTNKCAVMCRLIDGPHDRSAGSRADRTRLVRSKGCSDEGLNVVLDLRGV